MKIFTWGFSGLLLYTLANLLLGSSGDHSKAYAISENPSTTNDVIQIQNIKKVLITDPIKIPVFVNEKEVDCLAKNIFFEARDQSEKGMIAVGEVVLNRAKSSRWPDDFCKVVYQKSPNMFLEYRCQFSWVCEDHKNMIHFLNYYKKILAKPSKEVYRIILKDERQKGYSKKEAVSRAILETSRLEKYSQIRKIAKNLYIGKYSDITHGSTHYHAYYVNPIWSHHMKKTVKIGAHIFYKG